MDATAKWRELLALGDVPDEEFDEDAVDALAHELMRGGDPGVLELALSALHDPDWWRRAIAARVLGEFGFPHGRPFGARVAPALATAARRGTEDDTRAAMVNALGRADDPTWVPELLRYVDDSSAPVRKFVASSLPIMFAGDDLSDDAVSALITLTRDDDPEVRDWATFALGSQSRLDRPDICAALVDRLDDAEGDTRFEATLGLARRGDRRILPNLSQRLGSDSETYYLLDLGAAAEVADPDLLPLLERLHARWREDDDLHYRAVCYAIERCHSEAHDRARKIEDAFVAGVNQAIAESGWTIALSGRYPLTVVIERRPDGEEHDRALLWEDVSPQAFDLPRQIRNWSVGILAYHREPPG